MKKSAFVLLSLLLVLIPVLTGCETLFSRKIPTPTEDFYVYDKARVLSNATRRWIVAKNDGLSSRSGVQIVVVCVRHTGATYIADYAHAIFNEWGIGDAEKNNGVLLLLSVETDDYYALQGKGLENILPSGLLKLMLEEDLEPHFSVGEYDAGVRAIFSTLVDFFETVYLSLPAEEINPPGGSTGDEPADSGTGDGGWDGVERDASLVSGRDAGVGSVVWSVVRRVFLTSLAVMGTILLVIVVIVIVASVVYRPKNPSAPPRPRGQFHNPNPASLRWLQRDRRPSSSGVSFRSPPFRGSGSSTGSGGIGAAGKRIISSLGRGGPGRKGGGGSSRGGGAGRR